MRSAVVRGAATALLLRASRGDLSTVAISARTAATAATAAATPFATMAAAPSPLDARPSWPARAFGLPPLADLRAEHFAAALEADMAAHLAEARAIAASDAPPSFDSVVAPLDRAGAALDATARCFGVLCASATYPALQAVEREFAPRLASHAQAIYSDAALFARLDAVHAAAIGAADAPAAADGAAPQQQQQQLTPEQRRCLERLHLDFVRAGARFDSAAQARNAAIVARLAELQTAFSQNLLADETEFTIELAEADLAGCPPDLVAAARQAAEDRGRGAGAFVITLSRSLVEPFLTYSPRRDLRERAWREWTRRGELSAARDNAAVAVEILQLRGEQAALHGHATFGAYQLADTMAGSPAAVTKLLQTVWPRARAAAEAEREALLAWAVAHGELKPGDAVEPHDWRYFAEKVRAERFAFDDSVLKPYLSLEAMRGAIFDCARELFGLAFVPRPDLTSFHPDAKVFEVQQLPQPGAAGEGGGEGAAPRTIALFVADDFARPNKNGGAWMSELRTQHRNGEDVLPIVTNNNNFAKGSPTLLSFDDAVTLYHEFGHGLHGILSRVTYKSLAGTSVLRDFVELPSQLFEHFLSSPEVLRRHARHVETGEVIPDALLAKLKASRTYNAGFDVVEYTASALLDQALHALDAAQLKSLDLAAFEREELARLGMPSGIVPRHRPPHFSHLFSGSSYAAAYYCYLYAEVLDADAFDAFTEAGSVFDRATADRVRRFIYSSGNSIEPGAAFRAFRGRDPVVEPMLRKKGLLV